MMGLGAIGFLEPMLLGGLLLLPLIWWLLRFTPPRPKTIVFPPTRLLKDLQETERTPQHSPWWLTALRMLLAALLILALAQPVLHPDRETLAGQGPLVLVVDNGWASASHWQDRLDLTDALLSRATRESRPVLIAGTAGGPQSLSPTSPEKARETAAGLLPKPWQPQRGKLAADLKAALADKGPLSIVWLSDGLDYGEADAFAVALQELAGQGGSLTVARPAEPKAPVALRASLGAGGGLEAHVVRAGGAAREAVIEALSGRGDRLGEVRLSLAAGATSASGKFDLPLEIRNQVARLQIEGERSAGAVYLLDARSRWRRVGIVSGEAREESQPLLSPLYYVERALAPYAEVASSNTSNVAEAVHDLLGRNLSVLILADIGKLVGGSLEEISAWVEKGGTLVRFAGPRLEQSADDLLPSPLRRGGRTLGGSLSWSTPQQLAQFEETSLFAGLPVPGDVTVRRQVLADPAAREEAQTWARLKDGTPLVSAAQRGAGLIVLFHVTANSDWSTLPMSGLFVEMLRRIVERSTATAAASPAAGAPAAQTPRREEEEEQSQGAAQATTTLAPIQVLDGFGQLGAPSAAVAPLRSDEIDSVRPGPEHPPGYYGPSGTPHALNVIAGDTVLKPLPGLPQRASVMGYGLENATHLKPWLLFAAVIVFLLDMFAVLLLGVGLGFGRRLRGAAAAGMTVAALGASLLAVDAARAQAPVEGADKFAMDAALNTRLAYVLTGDVEVDAVSQAGLTGLSKVLRARTAVEPAEPMGVDVNRDELAFFPLLYWPVLAEAEALSDATLARIDAYMKQGGMIVFDTRDYQLSLPSGGGSTQGPGAAALQRLLGKLDVPPLEPVPENHVLTKSFYLMRTFPGRWDGGTMWVEAEPVSEEDKSNRARRSDGVSSILITSNDLAAAWALDADNRPLYPVVPGGDMQREMAFRGGVNIVMYALTGNYKADQVHVPALLERLGQ